MPSSWTILEVVDLELHGPKHPAAPPMTLGNMRKLGVQRLIAYCLNQSCSHGGLINVSKFADDIEVPSFGKKVVCAKCSSRGRHIDVRPSWKEQPARPTVLRHD